MSLYPRQRTRLWLVAVMAAVLALLATGFLGTVSAQAAQGCEVDYKVTGQWSGGFNANVEVTNLGEPIKNWDLEWTWPNGQSVTDMWNAKDKSKAGSAKATGRGSNAAFATGGSTSFGFTGSWSGANTDPAEFRLNGHLCEPTTPVTAMEQVAAMQPGLNVGNSLDALGGETAWGNPLINEELLQTIKANGYKSIRLPVSWDEHTGPGPDYTIDPAWLDRVAQVVDWAIANDLQVMVNQHDQMWTKLLPDDRENVLAKFDSMWTQIAERFKYYPSELSFESINEPQFPSDEANRDAHTATLNVAFHEAVRTTGGNNEDRLLVLPTWVTNSEQPHLDALKATIDSLDDPMIAATVHFYGFWPFSVNVAGVTTYDEATQQDLENTFQRVNDTFVDNDIPVIVGEWGVLGYDYTRPGVPQSQQYGELLKFFEATMYQAREQKLTLMLWDAGSYLNRNTLEWRDPLAHSYMESGLTTRSGTTSFDSIYIEKAGTIADESLTLNRNGLEFEGLWHGDTALAEGADYTVEGDMLTLTASALTRLAGERAYGVNSTIEARFSDGVPWQIHVITYDTPQISDLTGTMDGIPWSQWWGCQSSCFAIPTEFNGDELSTMEAKYADGTNAGPNDWTAFKEFWWTYRPDYDAGTISLTPDFFNEVRDDEPVTLTFHFWGGGTIDYTVTKSGTTVTGTSA
ncbi:cellulase family glycosylhydrolase [Arthrobacter rhizosphaerae]|uniref:cellulase family glycosylhydrolase n=1 Tax=Arthrobacter rhizosphaerae TaxID=2855490 RepID=UPI001FF4F8F8|nr:cellulase family glycosylhydrolase [Arthrobacter rhizosphaerae]